MKKTLLLFFAFISVFSRAQTTKDYTIQVRVTIQESPTALVFQWAQDTNAVSYTIGRKLKDATTWTTIAAGLPDTTSQFIDLNVAVGDATNIVL